MLNHRTTPLPGQARRARRTQTGMALLEVLAALLILALGIAGLAWSQARLLADGRTATARAVAVIFAADLANRMMFNRQAAMNGDYALGWDERPQNEPCSEPCSGDTMARADLSEWRAALASALPRGNATVFRSVTDPRQIGIAIAWAAADGPAAADVAYHAPFAIEVASHGVACPEQQLCHVAYVQP